jgi:hypothetical protein
MHIKLEKVFTDYLMDLAEFTEDASGGRIFNVEKIKKGFAPRDDLELPKISFPTRDAMDMEIGFRSIETAFPREEKLQKAGIASFAKIPNGCSIRFHLDHSNFIDIREFLPFFQNHLFE